MVFMGQEYQERAASLRSLCEGIELQEAPPRLAEFARYTVDVDVLRIAGRDACALEPDWRFVDDCAGGKLIYGPDVFPLAQVYFESQYRCDRPWRWSLFVNVAEDEHGASSHVLDAMGLARSCLANIESRRSLRCPCCVAPCSRSCQRDVVLVPSVVLAVRCLRAPGHDGDHLPICEACYKDAGETWLSGVLFQAAKLKKAVTLKGGKP